jgi:protein-S-isoprenylcysteine O-methyltransferase Ste14
MKITGSAPKIAIPSFIYLGITVVIDIYTKPLFKITLNNYTALFIVSIILLIIGISMVILTARKLLKSFKAGALIKDGLYRVFRNPMYASYMLFNIPGICLLFNSWIVLTTVIVNITLFKIFIKDEHKYLEEKFGDEYKKYLDTVLIKFL